VHQENKVSFQNTTAISVRPQEEQPINQAVETDKEWHLVKN